MRPERAPERTPERAWVRLESGRRLNLLAPDPADGWTDRNLAIGLSRTSVTPSFVFHD